MIRKIVSANLGKKKFQRFFEKLHKLSLLGMNYGSGADFHNSGEIYFLSRVAAHYRGAKSSGLVIFDVGANKGDYSEAVLHHFDGLPFTIHAFEPGKEIFVQLQEHVGADARVTLNNTGLSDQPGTLKLYKSAEHSEVATVYKRDNQFTHGFTYGQEEEITLTTLDAYCRSNNIRHISFLKMDVEGHEFSILKGAGSILQKTDIIQFEFSAANIDSRTYLADFISMLSEHFLLYRVLKDGLQQVKYDVHYEIFPIVNYVAINKSVKGFKD